MVINPQEAEASCPELPHNLLLSLVLSRRRCANRHIATVGNQLFRLGKAGQEASGSRIIATVPGGQQPVHRPARLVTHRVWLRIQATVRAANISVDGLLGVRLAAIRWAFR